MKLNPLEGVNAFTAAAHVAATTAVSLLAHVTLAAIWFTPSTDNVVNAPVALPCLPV